MTLRRFPSCDLLLEGSTGCGIPCSTCKLAVLRVMVCTHAHWKAPRECSGIIKQIAIRIVTPLKTIMQKRQYWVIERSRVRSPARVFNAGASWMQGHDIIFDLEDRRLGWATADCPQYVERPEPVRGAMPPWMNSVGYYPGQGLLSVLPFP